MLTTPAPATARPFCWTIRVYYEDTDTGGVVYYANYLKFFERVRTEWLRAAGFEQRRLSAESGLQFVVVEVNCRYREPARLDDLLEIDLAVARAGRASIVFDQAARRDGTLLATATVKAACIDARRFVPVPMPDHMLEAFRSLMTTAPAEAAR
jgi:acyl-CoA thioester hydrolase